MTYDTFLRLLDCPSEGLYEALELMEQRELLWGNHINGIEKGEIANAKPVNLTGALGRVQSTLHWERFEANHESRPPFPSYCATHMRGLNSPNPPS